MSGLLWLTLMAGCGETPMTPSPPTPSPPPATFTISGVVYEHTPAGVRPLGGIPLDISQSALLCNITAGAESGLGILVEKEGYRRAFLLVGRPSTSTTYDVELVRQ